MIYIYICDPLYKNQSYVAKMFSMILTRVNRAHQKLSFDISDIVLWFTM